MSSALLILQLFIAFFIAFNLPFIIIRTYYFLTNTEKQEYPPSNRKFFEAQESSLFVLFFPTYVFELILEKLSALDFAIPLVIFLICLVLLFFFGKEVITLGNALNWNWFDWIVFVPAFLFTCHSLFDVLISVNKKEEEKETDLNGLFE